MEQESQQGTKRTYAQAIRKKTKPPQETHPQEGTEPDPPQETTRLTLPEQDDADEPYLIHTRENLWRTTEDLHQTRLLKSSSAVLHFPRYSNIDAVDLINALEEIGLCSRYVKAVQCCPQPDVFNVTFHTPRIRECFLSIGRFTVNGIPALLNDSESPISFIVVKSAPAKLPNAAIIARLKCFGDVLSFRRCKHYGTGIENGTHTARMRLRTPIPSYVRIASETLYVYYTGQTRTCRRCNLPGHEARQYNNFACFNCDELGHVASACFDSLRCSICKSAGHKANHFPFAVDALNEKHSITTSLVRTLESVPPSIASSSSDEQNDERNDDNNEQDGDTESILEDAETLDRYLIASAHSSTHLVSPHSSASTVKSSVQATPESTPFLFSEPGSPEFQFAAGSQAVILPSTEATKPATSTAKAPKATTTSKNAASNPKGTHKSLPQVVAQPARRNSSSARITQKSATPSPTVIPETPTTTNTSTATNIPGPSQAWVSRIDDDQESTTSKRGHDEQGNEGFILVRKKTKPAKTYSSKRKT